MLPIAKRLGKTESFGIVRIAFRDEKSERIFSNITLLESHFGHDTARKIANRLAMLIAAKDLTFVDERPPIGLKPVGAALNEFTVDLGATRKLRFAGVSQFESKIESTNLSDTREIKILGVE